MANSEEKPGKKVSYKDIKPTAGLPVSREDYCAFLDIYHYLRPYLDREITVTKEELKKRFPDRKQMVDDVWTCVFDMKLKWPDEMVGTVFNV